MSIPAVTPLNDFASNANFVPIGRGNSWEIKDLPIKASTAIPSGAALCTEVSGGATTGYLTLMPTVTAKGQNFAGILVGPAVLANDVDYASTTKTRGVAVPITPYAEAQARVGAGTLTTALVGSTVAFFSDSASIDVGTLGQGCVITAVRTATNAAATPALVGTALVNFNIANTTTSA